MTEKRERGRVTASWWGRFLSARHGLIREWTAEGRTPEEIAETLSMDPTQVRLIAMTPYFDHTFGELLPLGDSDDD